MLKVDIERGNGSAEVKVRGRLVHGKEADLFRQAVEVLTECCISIDLSELESVDAAGLGTLVFLQHQLNGEDRELILHSPPEYFVHLLRLTALEKVLNIGDICAA
jgi:anti-anti-sigma factor